MIYKNLFKTVKILGVTRLLQYFFFQKILRINGSVPWPVHWSSIVVDHNNIHMKYWRPLLGFMPGQYIQAKNGITIGENVRIGPGVKIISASHDIYDYDKHDSSDPIIIGNHCWLAANCVILPGVKIAEHTIVAAGAVVTKSFLEGNCVLGGVPAKIVKVLHDYQGKITY
ncbi:acyltransferase [Reichenbachiella sp. MSK19-1]|uniref:acyltransferase n=1 Tax=Reichenbachiella sp. MSK19-1 TaxID=1897631 RepID=UPI000E6C9370|nr:acyltransferase [Reichenbachiella sp. MSK19-1]RJE71712.1 hypothetical protein BGP76_06390 [Reichenbachiella sp. MSK19-1]